MSASQIQDLARQLVELGYSLLVIAGNKPHEHRWQIYPLDNRAMRALGGNRYPSFSSPGEVLGWLENQTAS